MGNPLLDISASVKTDLLTKHKLKANDAIQTEEESIFKDLLEEYKVDYMGCVGEDSSRKILEEKALEAGVKVRYQVSEKPTGWCAVLITDQNRSLVTKLDAANHFTVSHLEEESNWELVKTAK